MAGEEKTQGEKKMKTLHKFFEYASPTTLASFIVDIHEADKMMQAFCRQ